MEYFVTGAAHRASEDEQILSQIFSVEVWTNIFKKCDPAVLTDLANKFPCIRNRMLHYQTNYLFPLVWNILQKYYVQILEQHFLEEQKLLELTQEMQAFGSLNPASGRPTESFGARSLYIDKNVIHETLKLRLVCKSWNIGVQTCYLKNLENFHGHDDYRFKWMENQFNNLDDIIKFENAFMQQRNAGSPNLLTRSIVIGSLNSEISIHNILEFIGNNVWYCKIEVANMGDNDCQTYFMLKQALDQMPNLKTLDITYDCRSWTRSMRQLMEIVQSRPLQKLGSLESLTTTFLPFPIFNELLRRNCEIKSLSVERQPECAGYDILAKPMLDLKVLSWQIYTVYDLFDFERLCNICKIVRLDLHVNNSFLTRRTLNDLLHYKLKHAMVRLTGIDYY